MNRAHTRLSWLFLVALLAPLQTFAATLTGKVVKVADGDTITILVGTERHRIRLQGIDAPERKQPFGRASGRSLSALVAGKQLRSRIRQARPLKTHHRRCMGALAGYSM
jgi:micrococcal nuclease